MRVAAFIISNAAEEEWVSSVEAAVRLVKDAP